MMKMFKFSEASLLHLIAAANDNLPPALRASGRIRLNMIVIKPDQHILNPVDHFVDILADLNNILPLNRRDKPPLEAY